MNDLEQARADWATADAIYDELQIIEDWPEDSQDIRAGARDVIRKALAAARAEAAPAREPFADGRDHLTVSGTFRSDKYPWCPAGFVPLKITDPAARDLLAEYARRRGIIDGEFVRDLLEALANVPEEPNPDYLPFLRFGQEIPR